MTTTAKKDTSKGPSKAKRSPKSKNGAPKTSQSAPKTVQPAHYKMSPTARAKANRGEYTMPVMVYLTEEQKMTLVKEAHTQGLSLAALMRNATLEALRGGH